MSKIKVSTVKMQADVEAIMLNSSFVAKAVRAADVANNLKNHIEADSKRYELDEEGNRKLDKDGKPIQIVEVGRSHIYIESIEVEDIYNRLIPFVEELCTALLGEDA